MSATQRGAGKVKTQMWLSPDVKGAGLVKMKLAAKHKGRDPEEPEMKFTVELAVAGFGNKDKPDWGKTIEEVQAAADEADDPKPASPKKKSGDAPSPDDPGKPDSKKDDKKSD
jgi:hypothetical protein